MLSTLTKSQIEKEIKELTRTVSYIPAKRAGAMLQKIAKLTRQLAANNETEGATL